MIFLITLFVIFAFGVRVATYAARNLSPSHSVISFVKARHEDATGSNSLSESGSNSKTQSSSLNSLRFSILRIASIQIFPSTHIQRYFFESDLLASIDLRALRRPPRS